MLAAFQIALVVVITPTVGYAVRPEVTPIVQPGLGDDDQPGKEGDVEQPFATASPLPNSPPEDREATKHDAGSRRVTQRLLERIEGLMLQIRVLLRRS
jgi:hypothetical protein